MDQYTVIIADIKGSRKMRAYERYEWQLFLKSAIVQINEDCADAIEAQFMITKGDEFQGVLKNLSDVHRIMIKFERLIFPLILRYGVGFGVIQKMGSNIPIEMDGQAFHRANAALKKAKKKKYTVYINTDNPGFDLTVNAIYQLIYAIKGRWSEINFNRYWKYKEMGTYEKVAQQEGVSTQAVWDSLHNSNAIDVINAENALDDILCEQNVTNSFTLSDKQR
ncbi:MAG: SatD family protein [Calditrichales bacterium]|nr:SatD family protein [Calditrichales bacterium]